MIAKVYTREIFKEVKKELKRVVSLCIEKHGTIATSVIYKLSKFGKLGHVYKVLYDRNNEKLDRQCGLFNSHGIPCSHIFCVIKQEQIVELPKRMIMKR